MSGWRHHHLGTEIDRRRPIRFTFDGRQIDGFEGDTLASALLASGVQVLGRSFKYHRPRGLWGQGSEEPNAIFDVTVNGSTTPNCRATTTFAVDGMQVRSINGQPHAARDRRGALDFLHRFIPAGFYYKTFMAAGWMCWEPMIRRLAGLGHVDPQNRPPADTAQMNASCDVLVVGAGPAGLATAIAAANAGKHVWLIESAAKLGGSLRWRGGNIDGEDWPSFVTKVAAAVEDGGGRVLTGATVWGAFDHGMFAVWQRGPRDIHWRLRAAKVILAAGAIERPMWFANNDLPGIMSAEAAMSHLICYGAVPGKRITLATSNDASYSVADAMTEAGASVTIADARPDGPKTRAARVILNASVTRAKGRFGIRNVLINGELLDTDALLISGGYTPSEHLWCQAGGKLDWNEATDALIPRTGTAEMHVVGAANGAFGLAEALATGHAAGGKAGPAPTTSTSSPNSLTACRPDPSLPGRQWVDLQNDVTLKDVGLAAREGFTSVEHLKRYTTLGMATDQGKTSNFAGLAAMAAITGRTIPETGTTTYRPPFQPVPLKAIAGQQRGAMFNPLKRLALEDAHRAAGAKFREYGGWLRPSVYGVGKESAVALDEAKAAREGAALFDASPLGKLEVIGPKAAELLDFTGYVRMSTLKLARARYGFMLSETGIVYDDGVVLRLAEDRFIVSASSSHVDGVRFRLEDARQDRFERQGVFIHDVTMGWTTLTVSGPLSGNLLAEAGVALPNLPHMGVCETQFEGYPLRIARVSFTGDKSFELSVPTHRASALRDRLETARAEVNGRWIGLEAVMILRAEKGFIVTAKDTDGLTMPHDLGWSGPRDKREDEYLGKRSLFTTAASGNGRHQLVGFATESGAEPLKTGAHLVEPDEKLRSLGYVTSSYPSATLDRPIAIGLLENGRARIGQKVGVFNDGEVRLVEVTIPCAVDPNGDRLNG